jgi:hypothetical protein
MSLIDLLLQDANISDAFKAALRETPAGDYTLKQVHRAAYVQAPLRFDWGFEFSDDHTVWSRGRVELERLRAERSVIDPDGVLWAKHAHPDYRHG